VKLQNFFNVYGEEHGAQRQPVMTPQKNQLENLGSIGIVCFW
jgi:hypothetical protein